MTGVQFLFYGFAAMMVASALLVITVRNPVRAALFLVLTFFATSAIWLLMEAEFLAITLVLVYVGAVMVLFLFVVMMLDINLNRLKEGFIKYLPIGVGVATIFGGMLTWLLYNVQASSFKTVMKTVYPPPAKPMDYSNTKELGEILYTVYVYPFEIAAIILLVAIVAAIALTFRRRPTTKYQNPDQQISVKRADRLRVVKMDTEEKK
jgi:NADH-quinone oxidoreductase subunit J